MLKLPQFLLGLLAGASLVAFPLASLWLYLATGKVPLPFLAGCRLLTPEVAAERLEWLRGKLAEGSHV